MRLIWLCLLLALTGARRPPPSPSPVCEGAIACCLDTLCVDCECQECLREGGVPAGPNTTCANDRCVCCEEPPLCDSESFCHTAYEFCCELEACYDRWIRPFDDKWQFCSCLDDVLEEACLTVEHVCESETTMGVFIGMLASMSVPFEPAAPLVYTGGHSYSGLHWLLGVALLFAILLALLACFFCCRPTQNHHHHQTPATLAHYR